jgi:hypothetical protein
MQVALIGTLQTRKFTHLKRAPFFMTFLPALQGATAGGLHCAVWAGEQE